jgi:uncharacterized membrane protein
MPFRWSGRTLHTLSAAAMSALLLTSAAKHIREPEFFHQVVPEALCRNDSGERRNGALAVLSREEWVAATGLLEAAAAVGLLIPATRATAATGITAMFTVFLAGHLDALRKAYGPEGTRRGRQVHTLRLPLQAPLIAWAWTLTKRNRRP